MKYAVVLFGIFMIFVIVLADTGHMPRFISVLYDFPNGDKVGHFILFGILNFFITHTALASFPTRNLVWTVITSFLFLAVFVAAEEYSQNYFSHRTADLIDLLASYLGMFIGGVLAFKFHTKI